LPETVAIENIRWDVLGFRCRDHIDNDGANLGPFAGIIKLFELLVTLTGQSDFGRPLEAIWNLKRLVFKRSGLISLKGSWKGMPEQMHDVSLNGNYQGTVPFD